VAPRGASRAAADYAISAADVEDAVAAREAKDGAPARLKLAMEALPLFALDGPGRPGVLKRPSRLPM
jgi:hypothetical protein